MKRSLAPVAAAALALASLTAWTPAPSAHASFSTAQAASAALDGTQWNIDVSHSSASFSVRHMMVTTVRGQLGPISGRVDYDGRDAQSVRADVRVDVNGISTQNAKRDNHLRSDDFFDVANHPEIRFVSKRVEPGAAGRFTLVGDLTMRGTTKEVRLDVEGPTPPVKDQRGVRIGATASTKVNRLEYGLKYNSMIEAGPVVGDEVTITIDLQLTRPSMPAGT